MALAESDEISDSDDDVRFTVMVEDVDDLATCFVPDADTDRQGQRSAVDAAAPTVRFRPRFRPPCGLLRVFHDNQTAYEDHILCSDRTLIGRVDGQIQIPHDRLMSSRHAEVLRTQVDDRWQWELRDLGSTNGTFVNVDRAKLTSGVELLLGSGRYRFLRDAHGHVLQHILEGTVQDSIPLAPEGTLIGRSRSSLMDAFNDPCLDPKHAFIRMGKDQKWRITNTRSVNGVWYRVSELKLRGSCFVQMGEQRFGFIC